MIIPSMEQCEGFEIKCNDIQLKWLSNDHIPSDQRLSVCGKCTGNCNRCSCGKNELACTLLCKCLTNKCQNRKKVSNSQDLYLNQILMDDTEFNVNHNKSSCDLSATKSMEVEDEEISRDTYSWASSYISDAASSGYDLSQLYESPYRSMSSMIENDNIDNDTLSIINIDHNYCKRSCEKIKENSIVSERKRRTIHKSLSELQAIEYSTKNKIVQSQKINSFDNRFESSFSLFSSSMSFSQPATSTPRTTKSKTNKARQVIEKENNHDFDGNMSSISFPHFQDIDE
ncbi:unnamed protein product [Rotaria sp. Silwood1]|nr:unnamed protein product [Rotaria sp. Silwood1]CAF1690981.1 unnamed protein product [Rotaria sp. Silwood1]CAF3656889.1 unnamed protein product [Rotaria sp. Silwood1]